MLSKKVSKVKKLRGTNSHGWGHKKKHRGAGNRGGKGLSGTGARGDAQKSGILTRSKSILQKIAASKGIKMKKIDFGKNYFGKFGFTSIKKSENKVLSLLYVENNFNSLVEKGIIVKDKTDFVLDLLTTKYDKVLGKGNFTKKIKLIAKSISNSAKEKIESAGGSVEIIGNKNSKKE